MSFFQFVHSCMICSRNPTNSFCNCWRGFSLCWCTQCFFYHKLSFTAMFLLSPVIFFSSGFIFWLSLLFNTNWTVHFSPALGFQICGSSVTYNRCFITQWYSQVQVLRLYSSAAWCPVSWVLLLGCCFCSFGSTASTVHFRCSCYFHTHGSFYI